MRLLPFMFLALVACGHSESSMSSLPLQWRGVGDTPRPSPQVAESFAQTPVLFRLRDLRPDPTAVGRYEDNGFVVRTNDNVAEYCTTKMGEMLASAGARLNEQKPVAVLETELLEYNVVEGGTFHGIVRIRAIIRRGADPAWARMYMGKSTRWGKSHSPDNFNEALSNALADATQQMVKDVEFARALLPSSGPNDGPPPPPPGG